MNNSVCKALTITCTLLIGLGCKEMPQSPDKIKITGNGDLGGTELKHVLPVPIDGKPNLVGFNDQGSLLSANLLGSTLAPLQIVHLPLLNLYIVELSKPSAGTQSESKTSNGQLIFGQCGGLISFEEKSLKTDCFDETLGKAENVQYSNFFVASVNQEQQLFAVKKIKTATDETHQVVLRSSSIDLRIMVERQALPEQELVSAISGGLLYRQKKTITGAGILDYNWTAYLASGRIVKEASLTASGFLGKINDCFVYFGTDPRKLLSTCAVTASEPTINTPLCRTSVDEHNFSFEVDSPIIASEKTAEVDSFLNAKGRMLRVNFGKLSCGLTTLKHDKDLVSATISGEIVAFTEAIKGLNVVTAYNGVTKSMLSNVDILNMYIVDGVIFFVGKNLNGKVVSGSIKPDGSELFLKEFKATTEG